MSDVLRILKKFVTSTIIIAIVLSIINFSLFAYVFFSGNVSKNRPTTILKTLSKELKTQQIFLCESTKKLLNKQQLWVQLINNKGESTFNYNLPNDVPQSYSLIDIAKLTRSFLNDYPVYVWQNNKSLIILGYPKNSVAKYYFHFPVKWIQALPLRVILLLIFNITIGITLAVFIGTRLIKSIKPIVAGVHSLANENDVKLNTRGLFASLAHSLNETSKKLQQKNNLLQKRDEARSNWISGISHDIRTPLSMILGYASDLADNKSLENEQHKQAEIILKQSQKISVLVKDLNLVSMLEYEMQPMNIKDIRLSALIRQIVADKINEGLASKYFIELDIPHDDLKIKADKNLLLRAITNIVNNSIEHNPNGCVITVSLYRLNNKTCSLIIKDNGVGVNNHQLKTLTDLPYANKKTKTGRGFGLPMVYRIIKAHKGELKIKSNEEQGFVAEIVLNIVSQSM